MESRRGGVSSSEAKAGAYCDRPREARRGEQERWAAGGEGGGEQLGPAEGEGGGEGEGGEQERSAKGAGGGDGGGDGGGEQLRPAADAIVDVRYTSLRCDVARRLLLSDCKLFYSMILA